MQNLILDFGNTQLKFGVFEKSSLKQKGIIADLDELEKLVAELQPENVAISSVSLPVEEVLKRVGVKGKKLALTHKTPLPITNLYQTPETLGKDRLAAVLGAAFLFPKTDCLVIDAGTCITYDFLDAEGNYHGGLIAPGLAMKFKAMHTFTSRLPFLEQPAFVPEISGKTTAQAMQSGVYNGTLAEAEGIIKRYEKQAQNLHIILCGGDAAFFETNLKGRIFAIPELVLLGLNSLLIPHA